MKTSVIIPCYNAASYIKKALDSLEEQTFDHGEFEVILIDDCSSDSTVQTVRELLCHYSFRGEIYPSEKNAGPSLARQKGIAHATGNYVAFCDSDDWFEPSFLQAMYDATEGERNQIVFCNYQTAYSSGKRTEKDILGDTARFADKKGALTLDADGLWCGLYQKTLFSDLIFPDLRNGEDMAIIPILISRAEHLGFVKEPLYNYYQREASLSATPSAQMIAHMRSSFAYICQNIDPSYHVEVEYLGVRNLLYGALLNLFKQKKQKKVAKEILRSFEQSFPGWHKNPYLYRLPFYKKLYLWCVKKRIFIATRLLSALHRRLTK